MFFFFHKYLPRVNLALFILRFDSLGAGAKNTFNKNVIASEKSYPFHSFCQQESCGWRRPKQTNEKRNFEGCVAAG